MSKQEVFDKRKLIKSAHILGAKSKAALILQRVSISDFSTYLSSILMIS
jgi:hypothetical protein